MAKDASFDVVSEFDAQEMTNALDQARRDVGARYDLKDTKTEIDSTGTDITVTTDSDMSLNSVIMLIQEKITKRGLSPYILDTQSKEMEAALGGRVRKVLPLRQGLEQPDAKKIVASIKDLKLKVQASIQGEQVRVTGKNRDDLQQVISALREKADEWNLPLDFTNYR